MTTTTTRIDVRTRTLHLVDIENLLGDPDANGDDALRVLDDYLEAAHWSRDDLVIIAANPVLTARFAWRIEFDHRILTATGPDGADLALLAHAAPEFVARRAGRLVIGSGDHIFIQRALQVRDLGVGVAVVFAVGGSMQRLAFARLSGSGLVGGAPSQRGVIVLAQSA